MPTLDENIPGDRDILNEQLADTSDYKLIEEKTIEEKRNEIWQLMADKPRV